jgi:type IV pilus assembly protein PilW
VTRLLTGLGGPPAARPSRRGPPAAAGFTLIELMVGMLVALLVIGIVMSTFLSQQKSMQSLDLSRDASSASRDAMLSMQETVGRAGYGIDPRYAFDLRNYNCTNYTGATTAANACRDKVNGTDELVFVERDPNYYWAGTPTSTTQGCGLDSDPTSACFGHAWQVTAFSATSPYSVTINARANDTFLVGQVVQITCAKGANATMGTVKTKAIATAAGAITIALLDPVTNNHYRDAIAAGHDTCFDGAGSGTAAVGVSMFLVSRYRYFVGTFNGDPWLMLDRGLDFNQNGNTPENGQDTADLIPIAHGVEGLQVSYLLRPDPSGVNTAPDNNTNWVLGDTAGTVEEPDPFAAAPLQNTADTDASRFSKHPANIRGVRMRLTVRSLLTDKTQGRSWPGDTAVLAPATAIENRNDFTAVALGRFRRFFTSVVAATPNLNSKDPFIF